MAIDACTPPAGSRLCADYTAPVTRPGYGPPDNRTGHANTTFFTDTDNAAWCHPQGNCRAGTYFFAEGTYVLSTLQCSLYSV